MYDDPSTLDAEATVGDALSALKQRRVIAFAFKAFRLADKKGNMWKANCQHCKTVITEARGTTSGFVRYVIVRCLYIVLLIIMY